MITENIPSSQAIGRVSASQLNDDELSGGIGKELVID